jgi:hypothetical protein
MKNLFVTLLLWFSPLMVLHVDSAKQNAFFEKINSYPTEKIMRIGDAYKKNVTRQ